MRRCQFDLRKALARLHLLEGYLIALDNIDEVIRIVRSSKDGNEARPRLMQSFGLSENSSTGHFGHAIAAFDRSRER